MKIYDLFNSSYKFFTRIVKNYTNIHIQQGIIYLIFKCFTAVGYLS